MKYLIIFTLALFSFSCKTGKQNTSTSDIIGEWKYSYEDNKDDIQAYRPVGFSFPPSRGRTGITINKDGSCTKTGIAPTDGFVNYSGKWVYNTKDSKITFSWDDTGKGELEKLSSKIEIFKVVSATKEMMQLKKEK